MGKTNRNRLAAIGVMLVVLLTAIVGLFAMSGIKTTQTAYAGEEHAHNEVTFTEWTSTNSLPNEAGNYCLTADVTISSSWNVPTGITNLCLNGHVIAAASNVYISVITVESGATLNLYDCDTTTHYYYVNAKTYKQNRYYEQNKMYDIGEIAADGPSNPAYVSSTKKGTFKGGYITGGTGQGLTNESRDISGGGFQIYGGGTLNMYGGCVFGNYTSATTQHGNEGGGVYVYANGTFTMNGGYIIGNQGGNAAGGVQNLGTFIMNDGYIGHNTAGDGGWANGGGIQNGGTMTMNGGVIEGNEAGGFGGLRGKCGGGINNSGSLTINGGYIINNFSDNVGGGINNSGSLTINGGYIINNYNDITKKADNVYLGTDKKITLGSALTEKNSVGVTMKSGTGVFTSGWSTYMADADPADYFFSDNEEYVVYLQDGEAAIRPHAHDLTYTVSGATITATCSAEGCALPDGKATLTISAPAVAVYDGTAKTATLSAYNTTIFPDAVIKYFVGDTEVSECINAGSYVAKVSVGGVTAEVSFTINNWTIDNEDKGVVVEIEGSETKANITVEVEVKTDVSSKQSQADYGKIASNKLEKNEKITFVYDVKLIRTEIIGGVETKTEIQPSDIKAGATIVVRMDVPTELRGKAFKVLHIHSNEDVEFVEFTEADDGSYITVRTDKLSEFAFVIEDVSSHGFCIGWISFIVTVLSIAYLAIYFFLLKYRDINTKNMFAWIGRGCALAVCIFALVALCVHACVISVISLILSVLLVGVYIALWVLNKNENNKDDELAVTEDSKGDVDNFVDGNDDISAQNDIPENDDAEDGGFVMDASGNIFNIRYKKSFLAKLIQSSDETKAYYSELKNEVLAYNKIKSSVSWAYDSVNAGRSQVLKFAIRGKTLCVYFALDPDDYADSKYKVEKAEAAKYEKVPCMYRIKNDRRAKYAIDLIAAVCAKYGLLKGEVPADDYTLPYETTDALIEKGLIKELKVVATDVQIQRAKAAGKVAIAKGTLPSTADEEDEDVLVVDAKGNIFNIRYNKSFKAKLIQSSDEVKAQYAELKNEILSYKKTNDRLSWSFDSINSGRTQIVKFAIRGKTLCVYFALNADDYADSKYKVEKVESNKYEAVPCLYRIKNERRLGYAKDLFAAVAEKNGLIKGETPSVDYYLPYETTESLIKQELIKELKTVATNEQIQRAKAVGKIQYVSQVSAQEANAMISDEVAATMIEGHIGGAVGKKDIINVDVLSKNFNDGDTVTIDSLKEKKLVPQSSKQVKLLARGVLDKKLHIELQDYSIEAVKMIIAIGGTVKRV